MAKIASARDDQVAANKLASIVKLSEVDFLASDEIARDFDKSQIVFGDDNRKLVTNTKARPYRFVCRIEGTKNGVRKVGTAFAIGRRTLVTAAHNLWTGVNGQASIATKNRIAEFKVWPGQTETSKPYGSFKATGVAFDDYLINPKSINDAAVLKLDKPLPRSFSSLHWSAVRPADLDGVFGLISGYPACAPPLTTCGKPQEDQYFHRGGMLNRGGLLHYLIDTTGGQSGSPILILTKDATGKPRSTAVGIHVRGGLADQSEVNQGVAFRKRIASFIFEKLKQFE